MQMPDVMTPDDDGPHPLRDEGLPVCIPPGVARYPREWCLNDGHPKPTDPIPQRDIFEIENRLEPFVAVSQSVLSDLINDLTIDGPDISCNGRQIRFSRVFHFAKYGSKKDKRLQEDVLSMLKEVAKEKNFSLGEVKALLYVASRIGNPMSLLIETKYELEAVQRCRALLNRGHLTQLKAFDWGGDLSQFNPIIEKAVDYYEMVYVPKWTRGYTVD